MRRRVLAALADRPFDSTRTIPERRSQRVAATKKIENATFTPEEIKAISSELRGAEVPAWLQP